MPDADRGKVRQAILVVLGIGAVAYGIWFMTATTGGRTTSGWIDRLIVEEDSGKGDDIAAQREAGDRLLEVGVAAVPALIEAMKGHDQVRIRGAAAFTLARIVDEKQPDLVTRKKILDEIEPLLRKKPPFATLVGCSSCLVALAKSDDTADRARAAAPLLVAATPMATAEVIMEVKGGDQYAVLRNLLNQNIIALGAKPAGP